MKRINYVLVLGIAFSSLGLVNYSFAQETRSLLEPINQAREAKTQIEERLQNQIRESERNNIQNIQQRIQENQNNRRSLLTETKVRVDENRKRVISNIVTNSLEVIDRAISALESHSQRISLKINNLGERGVDITESQRLLNIAQSNLETAKNEISNLKIELNLILEKDEINTNEIRFILNGAKELLIEVRKSFVEVLKSLKDSLEEVSSILEN
jgi:hypothetical protein